MIKYVWLPHLKLEPLFFVLQCALKLLVSLTVSGPNSQLIKKIHID